VLKAVVNCLRCAEVQLLLPPAILTEGKEREGKGREGKGKVGYFISYKQVTVAG